MANVRTDDVQIKLTIDGSQSKTELDNLTRKAELLKEDLKGLKKGTQEYIDANKELKEVTTRITELREKIGLSALSINQLKTLSGQLNRELRDLSPGTESFINKSKELQQVSARLDEVTKDAKGIGDALEKSGGGFTDFLKKSAAFAGIQIGVGAVVSSLKQLGSESIDAAKQNSDAIADMEKALNLTTAEAKALDEQLAGIDTRTSQENLEGIAIAAGQLGIAADQADEFTIAVDQAVVALGDEFSGGVEDVTKSLGGLQKLFKQTKDESPADAITKIGSAVNALGADGSATGPVIADFTARIGQLADLAPEITQTLGLGAALQELGLTSEIAAGGVSNVLLTAAKDTAGFGKQIGLTSKEFENLINTDPNEVLLRLAASFKGASQTEIVSTLDSLGIKSQEATKVVELLASKTDMVRQKQELAGKEFEKGTSLYDEYIKKNTTAAAQVEKAEKSFATFRRELGEQLIPIYIKVLQYGGLILNSLRALPGFVSENRAAFALLALAVLTYNAAQIKEQATSLKGLALQKLKQLGLITEEAGILKLVTAQSVLTSAQEALNLAMAANPIGLIIGLFALMAFGLKQLYDRSETFRSAIDGLFATLKPLGAALQSAFGGNTLTSLISGLFKTVNELFKSFSGGKSILELFGYSVGVSVAVPLKTVVTVVQSVVDGLLGLVDVGKRVANFFGASFKIDPNGSFDAFSKNLKRNINSIGDTITGAEATKAQEAEGNKRVVNYQRELEKKLSQQKAAEAKAQQQAAAAAQAERDKATAAAAEAAAKSKEASAEQLKLREAALQAQLAKVQEGSEQELKLKKQLVLVSRDQELLDEKKTAADKAVVRSKAQVELDKLNQEYAKKQKELAEKTAKEQADVDKRIADLKSAALKDETERKIAQLTATAEKEMATAKGTAEQIAEQQRLIQAKLSLDIAAERKKQADQDFADQADLEKRRLELEKDEYKRRAGELRLAAAQEMRKLTGEEAFVAQQRELIQAKLQDDLLKLEQERIDKQRALQQQVVDIDEATADRREARAIERARKANPFSAKPDQQEKAGKLNDVEQEQEQVLGDDKLDINVKLAKIRDFNDQKAAIEDEYAERDKQRNRDVASFALSSAAQGVQAIFDFKKIASDKELAKVEKDKNDRLKKLDAEYKAGKISKESFEKQKSSIESNYDEKTRALKTKQAKAEKANNIAQSIIAGTLAVIAASANPLGILSPTAIATGVAALLATGKIIATPIPEFAKGGVVGGAWRGTKRSVGEAYRSMRTYASGGRINPVGGVPDVGQLHSGGGIQMIDGATGQHLGEWERGEPYMILSRNTYANNREIIDELLDTSMHRGGAPIRQRGIYAAQGAVVGELPATAGRTSDAESAVVSAIKENTAVMLELADRPVPAVINWGGQDDAQLENRLDERASIRQDQLA